MHTFYIGTFTSSNDVTDIKAFTITVTNITSMHIATSHIAQHFMD